MRGREKYTVSGLTGYGCSFCRCQPCGSSDGAHRKQRITDNNFITGDIRHLPYDNARFDAVISSAVLHFADSREDFVQMWTELMRVTKKGGLIFIRMSSNEGLNGEGTFPYNLTREDLDLMLLETEWVEPFKTVLVEERSMAVIMLRKTE